MLARTFKILHTLEAFAALFAAQALLEDAPAWQVALLAISLFLGGWIAYATVSTAVTYAFTRSQLAQLGEATPPWPSLATFVTEVAAMLVLFLVIQPFSRTWLGTEPLRVPPGDGPVALLVPGYFCNRGLWWWHRRALMRCGVRVLTVNLEPPLASLGTFAEQVHARIEAADLGAQKVVLVAHSMGGVVAREYIRRHGTARLARLVTMGSPHKGTTLALIGLGQPARDMTPASPFMKKLEMMGYPPLPSLAIWGHHDNYIAPTSSASALGTQTLQVDGLGHLSMQFSPRIFAALLSEIEKSRP